MILTSFIAVLKAKLGVFTWLMPVFAIIALTEAFYGQLIIALIAAVPPTGAVLVALAALKRGQKQTHETQKEMISALDGKLDDLMEARGQVQHAAGVEKERGEERTRVLDAAQSPKPPQDVIVQNPPEKPIPTFTNINESARERTKPR